MTSKKWRKAVKYTCNWPKNLILISNFDRIASRFGRIPKDNEDYDWKKKFS